MRVAFQNWSYWCALRRAPFSNRRLRPSFPRQRQTFRFRLRAVQPATIPAQRLVSQKSVLLAYRIPRFCKICSVPLRRWELYGEANFYFWRDKKAGRVRDEHDRISGFGELTRMKLTGSWAGLACHRQ